MNNNKQPTTMAITQTPHIAILPSPGMGHLIPLVEFAKRLLKNHLNKISITFIIPTDGSPSKSMKTVLDSLPATVNSIFLPPVDLSDVPKDVKIETVISLTVSRSLPSLRDVFAKDGSILALVVDLFGTDTFDVAKEFNVSPYIFFPSTAMTLSLFLYLPKLDETVTCEYHQMKEPVNIPGCVPVHGNELLDPTQDRKNDAYKWLLHHTKRYKLADGIMVNSFMELDGGAVKAINQPGLGYPPVYPIGPIVNTGGGSNSNDRVDESGCLSWLDEQPLGSVIFVSFGSGGTLSLEQITELAFGLESSNQRFLWVVRSPNVVANSTFFNEQSARDPFAFLPKGFLDRTKGRGMVVSSWAPQARVLSHSATGGFVTHCGWNSILESVVNGVPMVAWPLYAEQKTNAVLLTKDVKIAVRPFPNENGVIVREEIVKVVQSLMEGEEGKKIRNKMRELKDGAAKVLNDDGFSTKLLSDLVFKWTNLKRN